MDKTKVYSFSRTRNKAGKGGHGVKITKREIGERDGLKCNFCTKELTLTKTEQDHIIPVSIGGKIFHRSNLQLLCSICHRHKTTIDVRIINSLKKMKLLLPGDISLILIKDLHEIYTYLFNICWNSQLELKAWDNWEASIELYKENRKVDDGVVD